MTASAGDLTVVVPTKNAASGLAQCLDSIMRATPHRLIVVDGHSTDESVAIAEGFGATVLYDEGKGLPYARNLGIAAADTPFVALVDADVVFRDAGLEILLVEMHTRQLDAIQAALAPVAAAGYWSEALATHERWGRRRHKFGVAATVASKQLLLEFPFDDRFPSGEDIDMRHRLAAARKRIGISDQVAVEHHYGDPSFEFARSQFEDDGAGLIRMVLFHGPRALPLVAMPAAAAVRGVVLSILRRQPRWIRYYAAFFAFNYLAMVRTLVGRRTA